MGFNSSRSSQKQSRADLSHPSLILFPISNPTIPGGSSKRTADTPESRAIDELEERDETAAELSKRFSLSSLSTKQKWGIGAGLGLTGLFAANQFSKGNS
jgi:hypothetical protein